MERNRNITEQLLYQNQQSDETERTVPAVIESITDKTGNGKKFKVLEFVNSEGEIQRLNVFDPHKVEGLTPGDAVDLALKKSKTGWWNLDAVIRPEKLKDELEAFFDTPQSPQEPVLTPKQSEMPSPLEQARLDKEKGLRSMNAMIATSTYMSALVSAGVIKPTDLQDALRSFGTMHAFMMAIHDQPDDRRDTATNTK